MLAQRYTRDQVRAALAASWTPYPTAADRAAWEALPAPLRQAYIDAGDTALDYPWPSLPATLFLGVARTGNRNDYETANFERRAMLGGLVLAECMTGDGRYLDQIANGVWLVCEESYWGVPAHLHLQRAGHGLPDTAEPSVDLFAAETASLLAWTDYLLGPQLATVSPLIGPRIHREITHRILDPLLARDDFSWMGFHNTGRRVNNWNPWIVSNWITCALLIEADADRRADAIHKAMVTVDHFIDPYPRDGGCDEGPGYWGRAGASLFECLDMLRDASGGALDVYDEPLIAEIGRFVHRVQIADTYFINFADAPAVVMPDPGIVHQYGVRINDPDMQALGAWLASADNLITSAETKYGPRPANSLGRTLRTLFALDQISATPPHQPLPRDVFLPEIEVMVARDRAGSAEGLFVAAKGGHNNESHNHNDVGNFVVYRDGEPLIIDAGVEVYSMKTFGPNRYDIWTMQSAYHSLPTIDGVGQAPGEQFAARDVRYEADDHAARFALEIAGAYPPEAKLDSWLRTVALLRGEAVQIDDVYALNAPAGVMTLSLITPCTVDLSQPGRIALGAAPLTLSQDSGRIIKDGFERHRSTSQPVEGGRMAGTGTIHYPADKLTASVEEIAITDDRLLNIWGPRLARILLTAANPPAHDTWTIRVTG